MFGDSKREETCWDQELGKQMCRIKNHNEWFKNTTVC